MRGMESSCSWVTPAIIIIISAIDISIAPSLPFPFRCLEKSTATATQVVTLLLVKPNIDCMPLRQAPTKVPSSFLLFTMSARITKPFLKTSLASPNPLTSKYSILLSEVPPNLQIFNALHEILWVDKFGASLFCSNSPCDSLAERANCWIFH